MSEFHHTKCSAPGLDLDAGDVIRVFDGPFNNAVILGFNEAGDARVSRPYAYASGVGTCGPTPLLGAETYVLNVNNLRHLTGPKGLWPVLQKGHST